MLPLCRSAFESLIYPNPTVTVRMLRTWKPIEATRVEGKFRSHREYLCTRIKAS